VASKNTAATFWSAGQKNILVESPVNALKITGTSYTPESYWTIELATETPWFYFYPPSWDGFEI